MGNEETGKDQPLHSTWGEDWSKAEAQAEAYEESQEASNEHASEQEAVEPTDEGTNDDGTQDAEGGSGEEGLEAAGEAEDRTGEPDRGSEPGEGSSDSGHGRDGDVSRERGQQRELQESAEVSEPLPRAERIAQLRAEAEDLGLSFDGNSVTVSDRAKFRAEKREARAKITADRERMEAELAERVGGIEQRFQKYEALERAAEANDLDAVAEALGHQSWNHLSEEALRRSMNPEHRELTKLRRENAERERKLAAEAERQTAERRRAEMDAARANYKQTLSKTIGGLQDKTLAAFAEDPTFVATVLRYQEAEWDGEETIPVQEAAQRAAQDARQVYDRLHAVFGPQAPSEPESTPASEAVAEKPARQGTPRVVSQNAATDASPTESADHLDEQAWLKKWAPKVAQSETHPEV